MGKNQNTYTKLTAWKGNLKAWSYQIINIFIKLRSLQVDF